MEKLALLAKFKCDIACLFTDEKIENDYMIDTCVDLGDRDLKRKELSLLINLLENSDFINYKDGFDTIIGCDFSKIKELQNAYQ